MKKHWISSYMKKPWTNSYTKSQGLRPWLLFIQSPCWCGDDEYCCKEALSSSYKESWSSSDEEALD